MTRERLANRVLGTFGLGFFLDAELVFKREDSLA
jgi:hypothetical protein